MAACYVPEDKDKDKKKKKKDKDKEKEKPPACVPPEPPPLNKKQTIHESTICPVCTKRLVSPKLLPCFHTICFPCLKRRCRGKTPGDFTKCPICHCKFLITDKGVDDFQADFVAEFLLHAEDAPEKEKRSLCESCPSESDGMPIDIPPATSYCMDCLMKLCEGCTKPHARMRGENHRVLTLGKASEPNTSKTNSACEKHMAGMQQNFCYDCHANLCGICHNCKPDETKDMCKQISDNATAFMQQLEDDIDIITAAINANQSETSRLQKEKNSFLEELAKTEAAVVSKGDEVKKLVDTQVANVLEELASAKSKSMEKLAWATQAGTACVLSMRGFQNFGQLVKTEGTPYIISRVAEELNMHARATFLLKWQQDTKAENYHTPKLVFEGVDVESYMLPNADKGSLIGKLTQVDYTPGTCCLYNIITLYL